MDCILRKARYIFGARISQQLLMVNFVVKNYTIPPIAKFMGPAWGPPGSSWPQMGPMLAPWTLYYRDSNAKFEVDLLNQKRHCQQTFMSPTLRPYNICLAEETEKVK